MSNSYTDPDPGRSALITIDVQNDFTLDGAPARIPGTLDALPAMRRALDAFRAAARPIIHVIRLYLADGSNVDLCRRDAVEQGLAVARPGSDGAELADPLKPAGAPRLDAEMLLAGGAQPLGPREWAVYKPRWSAFHGTSLDGMLRGQGIDTVVLAGCNFPNCPRATIYDASNHDYRLAVVTDALSGLGDQGRRELEAIGVRSLASHQLEAWLNPRRPEPLSS